MVAGLLFRPLANRRVGDNTKGRQMPETITVRDTMNRFNKLTSALLLACATLATPVLAADHG
ncbi:MAG TPA: hypothetical protein DD385_04915, partial [Marinobacter sp.]|nr:hypothetical protein [Marinobacter sp.]